MERSIGFIERLRKAWMGGTGLSSPDELVLEKPESAGPGEWVEGLESLKLAEHLQMIAIVDEYVSKYVLTANEAYSGLQKGFALRPEVFYTMGEDVIYRANMNVFFQEPASAVTKLVYLVSLIRFADDRWRVIQVKKLMTPEGMIA
jgi:hypothetical protein